MKTPAEIYREHIANLIEHERNRDAEALAKAEQMKTSQEKLRRQYFDSVMGVAKATETAVTDNDPKTPEYDQAIEHFRNAIRVVHKLSDDERAKFYFRCREEFYALHSGVLGEEPRL